MRAVYGPNCVWSLGPEISVWVSDMRQTGLVTVRTGVEMGWVINEGGVRGSWGDSLSGTSEIRRKSVWGTVSFVLNIKEYLVEQLGPFADETEPKEITDQVQGLF